MDSKVNFTLVGTFVFAFILALVSFTFWLGKYGIDEKQMDYYTIYLEESVSGLNQESSIKYKGLSIGTIQKIKISQKNSEHIELLVEVEKDTPIKEDTIAVLESQGITGLKYIDLVGGSQLSPKLITSKDNIAVIKSKQSLLGSLGNSAQDITKQVNIMLNKLNILFSKNNINQVTGMISNTTELTSNLNKLTNNLNKIVINIDTKLNQLVSQKNITKLNSAFDNIEQFTGQMKQTLTKIGNASDSTNNAFTKFAFLIDDGKLDLSEITKDSLKKFDILMIEAERTIQNIEKTVDNIGESPSDILFKSNTVDYGPGEQNEN